MPRGLKREDVRSRIQQELAEDVGVIISKGNNKMDNIPNISLLPDETCPGQVAECSHCYAKQCMVWSTWAKVRWTVNTFYAKNHLSRFEEDVACQIHLARSEYFRIHVGGDFFSQEYLEMWCRIAQRFPGVKFLAFTKSFKLDYWMKPENLQIIWSVFPSTDFSSVPRGSRAWTLFDAIGLEYPEREYPRKEKAFRCTGKCRACGICFNMDESRNASPMSILDVKFKAHGSEFKQPREKGADGKWLSNAESSIRRDW